MGRKVFISVLGTGLYGKCQYVREDAQFESDETFFVQSATLQYINAKDWTPNDFGLILLTDFARKSNWNKTITKRLNNSKQEVDYEGLESVLERMQLPFHPKDFSIPNGNNEKEIWEIFTSTFNELCDGDELYFDVTHAFRFLPMLILVLCDYAKFLKNVTIKSITYGNYEARNTENNKAPIIDLLSLSQLQDWTFAAGQYLENGSVNRLVSLCEQEFKPILRETLGADVAAQNLKDFITRLSTVTEERKTCRGMDIIKSTSFKGLKESADNLEETFVDAFNPIFEKIKSSLVSFDENENVRNGFSAAVWCYDNGLFQQSATILQEFVVSFFCLRHDITIDDEANREIINKAFNIRYSNIPEDGWEIKAEKKDKLKEVLSDDLFANKTLISSFNNLTEVRNDFNHSGMRSKHKPMKPKNIKDNIKKCICAFGVILFNIKIN